MCRQRIQQATTGHRRRTGDPLYGIRRTLNTRSELLTNKQKVRLFKAFTANDAHVAVEVTYGIYQRLITAYENSGRREGKIAMYKLLKSIRAGVPKELPELARMGRSLMHSDSGRADIPPHGLGIHTRQLRRGVRTFGGVVRLENFHDRPIRLLHASLRWNSARKVVEDLEHIPGGALYSGPTRPDPLATDREIN